MSGTGKHVGCKGLCLKFYPDKKEGYHALMYVRKMKYCAKCEFRVKTKDIRCRCCGKMFRVGSHHFSRVNTPKCLEPEARPVLMVIAR